MDNEIVKKLCDVSQESIALTMLTKSLKTYDIKSFETAGKNPPLDEAQEPTGLILPFLLDSLKH